jgi:hypothetical protein
MSDTPYKSDTPHKLDTPPLKCFFLSYSFKGHGPLNFDINKKTIIVDTDPNPEGSASFCWICIQIGIGIQGLPIRVRGAGSGLCLFNQMYR